MLFSYSITQHPIRNSLVKRFQELLLQLSWDFCLISHADEVNFNKLKKKQQKSDNRVEERKIGENITKTFYFILFFLISYLSRSF